MDGRANRTTGQPFVEFREVDKSYDGRVLAVRGLNLTMDVPAEVRSSGGDTVGGAAGDGIVGPGGDEEFAIADDPLILRKEHLTLAGNCHGVSRIA